MSQIPSNKKAVKRRIKPYDYLRKGKFVKVKKAFKRTYYTGKGKRKPRSTKKQPIKKQLRREKASEKIDWDKAKRDFEERSERSKKVDIAHNSKIMFSVPNKLWRDAIGKFDIWGLDGFDAPVVDELPRLGLPHQVVKFQNEIYEANDKGIFTTPDIKVVDLDPKDVNNQKQFELENPNEEAFIYGETTEEYNKWLSQNAKLEDISNKLDYTRSDNKLYKIREIYNSLNLSKEEQKKLMFKLYNKIYENQIKSYTSKFEDFYEHKFDDTLERKISAEENRLKEIHKDPIKTKKSQEQYKTSELRMHNLISMLHRRGYYDFDTSSLREKMMEFKNGENDEIVDDFIKNIKEEGSDSDMVYIDDQRIKEDYDKMQEYYEQKSYSEYLEYLEQETQ